MIKQKTLPPSISSVRLAPFWGAAVVLILVVVALIPAMPFLNHMPNTDNSIFLLVGDKIRQGDLPYIDWYDHKPPLIFYLNALGLWLGQGSRWGVWAIELVSLSAAGLFGFAFLKRYFGVLAATLAVGATLLNLVLVYERGNLTEEYALPYQFAAFFLLAQEEKNSRPGWRMVAIGCTIAMASTLKQPLAGFGIAIFAWLLVRYAQQEQWQLFLAAAGKILLGFAAVWAGWFAYFYLLGIFPEFWDAAFVLNFALTDIPLLKRLGVLFSAVTMLWEWSGYFLAGMLAWLAAAVLLLKDGRIHRALTSRLFGWVVALAGLCLFALGLRGQAGFIIFGIFMVVIGILGGLGKIQRWLANRQEAGQGPFQTEALLLPLIIMVVDFPVNLVLSGLSGRNFSHYFTALLPSLSLLIAFLAYALPGLFQHAARRMPSQVWLAVLLIPVFSSGVANTMDQIGPRGDRQIEAIIDYVNANTRPDDTIYQWGTSPQVYFITGRDSPSRYFFPQHLFFDGYSGLAQTSEFLQALRARPPALIIEGGIERIPFLILASPESCDIVRDPAYYAQYVAKWKDIVPYDLPQMPQGMDEVYFWICQNYTPAGPVGELGWQVYRWKGK
jgi:hypothetical protein